MTRKRLGEMLLEAGVIDEHKLQAALGHQRKWGGRLGQALVDLKLATEAQIVEALSRKFGYEVVGGRALEAGPDLESALKLLPREFAAKYNLIPYHADSGAIAVAMADPANVAVVDEIRFRTGRRVKIGLAGDREIAEAVRRHYFGDVPGESISLEFEESEAQAGPIVGQFEGGSEEDFESFYSAPAPSPPPAASAARPAAVPAPRPAAVPAPRPAPKPAVAPPAPKPAAAPPAPKPAAAAPAPKPAAAAPAPKPAAAAPAPRSPAGPAAEPGRARELELEQPAAGSALPPEPEEKTTTLELPIEEAPAEDAEGGVWSEGPVEELPEPPAPAAARDELDLLEAVGRMADGEATAPEMVKPARMTAALVRLLIRKGVISEVEFLDEFGKR